MKSVAFFAALFVFRAGFYLFPSSTRLEPQ